MSKKKPKVADLFVVGRAAYVVNQKAPTFAHKNTKRAKTRAAQKARALTDW